MPMIPFTDPGRRTPHAGPILPPASVHYHGWLRAVTSWGDGDGGQSNGPPLLDAAPHVREGLARAVAVAHVHRTVRLFLEKRILLW